MENFQAVLMAEPWTPWTPSGAVHHFEAEAAAAAIRQAALTGAYAAAVQSVNRPADPVSIVYYDPHWRDPAKQRRAAESAGQRIRRDA